MTRSCILQFQPGCMTVFNQSQSFRKTPEKGGASSSSQSTELHHTDHYKSLLRFNFLFMTNCHQKPFRNHFICRVVRQPFKSSLDLCGIHSRFPSLTQPTLQKEPQTFLATHCRRSNFSEPICPVNLKYIINSGVLLLSNCAGIRSGVTKHPLFANLDLRSYLGSKAEESNESIIFDALDKIAGRKLKMSKCNRNAQSLEEILYISYIKSYAAMVSRGYSTRTMTLSLFSSFCNEVPIFQDHPRTWPPEEKLQGFPSTYYPTFRLSEESRHVDAEQLTPICLN